MSLCVHICFGCVHAQDKMACGLLVNSMMADGNLLFCWHCVMGKLLIFTRHHGHVLNFFPTVCNTLRGGQNKEARVYAECVLFVCACF